MSQRSGGGKVSHDGGAHVREMRQDVPKGGALLREADEEGPVSAGMAVPPRNERQFRVLGERLENLCVKDAMTRVVVQTQPEA